jgi:hypothetical protein
VLGYHIQQVKHVFGRFLMHAGLQRKFKPIDLQADAALKWQATVGLQPH